MGNLIEKDKYKKIENLRDNIYDINYSSIHCLGSYMNRNIYCFSRIENEEIIHNNYSIGVDNYPNSKKIAKLIKLLMINFPDNTKEHFINYIFNDIICQRKIKVKQRNLHQFVLYYDTQPESLLRYCLF